MPCELFFVAVARCLMLMFNTPTTKIQNFDTVDYLGYVEVKYHYLKHGSSLSEQYHTPQ